MGLRAALGWADRHQVALCLGAIAAGVATGLIAAAPATATADVVAPALAPALAQAVIPALALLLFATFLSVPFRAIGRALTDLRFLGTVLVANFVVVPLVVFGLSRFVADDRGLLLGVLLVLLTPCVDYVIVFTGLAGGDRARLLAASPVLMIVQIALLPVFLWLFAGGAGTGTSGADAATAIEVGPFVEAFLLFIALPLGAAAAVQWLARRRRAARALQTAMAAAMVPLMMATLFAVVGSQIGAIGGEALRLARTVPIYVAFVVIAVVIGRFAAVRMRLEAPAARAAVFSIVTRNSLVVLPLALALPPALGIAPLAVVTQTLIELVAMVVLVRLVPRLLPT